MNLVDCLASLWHMVTLYLLLAAVRFPFFFFFFFGSCFFVKPVSVKHLQRLSKLSISIDEANLKRRIGFVDLCCLA